MAFILIAVAYIVLKLLDVGFVSALSWHWAWLPVGCALLWWELADKFGYTQKRAMDKMEARKEARRQRSLEAMGRGDINKRR
ncbi:MAG: TIGR04438 family Trp-rich protein [Burkholderiales bacterium]|uniref:TIGR04438 family Trp-rich protein n=1 Tax=Inhella sp. TaxID=1921806 RepID=UPI001ACC1FD2|nr:TIGR04438 family Trp-rich protein [Burkholderiales bacterium]